MMKFLLKLIIGSSIIAWFAGFLFFEVRMYNFTKENETKADAIIVLTGAKGRVKAGINLLKKSLSDHLFISGVANGTSLKDILMSNGLIEEYDALNKKITLGYEAKNTKGNASELAKWVTQHDLKTLVIVTSDYHMIRSMAEISDVTENLTLIPHSVSYERNKLNTSLEFIEYHKFIYSRFCKIFNLGR